jgi:RNA recognition motif-containing protein
MRLFIENFKEETNPDSLGRHFKRFGQIKAIAVYIENKIGHLRRFAIVTFCDAEDAERAIKKLDNRRWHGTRLRVTEARGANPKSLREKGPRIKWKNQLLNLK